MTGGPGGFTWFSSASNPGFLLEAKQSMGKVLVAWESTLNGHGEERPADAPGTVRTAHSVFHSHLSNSTFLLFLPPLSPQAGVCSAHCLHGKVFRLSDRPSVIQET